jgi:hypothetical protein
MNFLLKAKDKSYNELSDVWSGMVSENFGWKKQDLLTLFDRRNDSHNSEMRVRYQWKYGIAEGVTATPSLFVNGVQVQRMPATADEFHKLLTDVHNSQQPKQIKKEFLQQ